MYYISVEHFYYVGTFNAPKNGPLKNEYGKKEIFSTIEQAQQYLYDLDIVYHVKNRTYTYPSGYLLDHAEYARPLYTIRKTRTKTTT